MGLVKCDVHNVTTATYYLPYYKYVVCVFFFTYLDSNFNVDFLLSMSPSYIVCSIAKNTENVFKCAVWCMSTALLTVSVKRFDIFFKAHFNSNISLYTLHGHLNLFKCTYRRVDFQFSASILSLSHSPSLCHSLQSWVVIDVVVSIVAFFGSSISLSRRPFETKCVQILYCGKILPARKSHPPPKQPNKRYKSASTKTAEQLPQSDIKVAQNI